MSNDKSFAEALTTELRRACAQFHESTLGPGIMQIARDRIERADKAIVDALTISAPGQVDEDFDSVHDGYVKTYLLAIMGRIGGPYALSDEQATHEARRLATFAMKLRRAKL